MRGCHEGLFLLGQFIYKSYYDYYDNNDKSKKCSNNKFSSWWLNNDNIPIELIQKIHQYEHEQNYICLYHSLMDF